MKLTGWKKLFPGAHIEQMTIDFEHNVECCSKERQLQVLYIRPLSLTRGFVMLDQEASS